MSKKISFAATGYLLIVSAVAGAVIFGSVTWAFDNFCNERYPKSGHVLLNEVKTSGEVVLITPAKGDPTLITRSGRVMHKWITPADDFMAYLTGNGTLFVAQKTSTTSPTGIGGYTGRIQELDWQGNVLWEYEDKYMHHDFDVLGDGKIVYLRWEKTPRGFINRINGGFLRGEAEDVWTDSFVVVDRNKNVVFKWNFLDHLKPEDFILNPYTPARDWSHANSIRYTKENPITNAPAYLISARHISTVFLVDAQTGEVIWKSLAGTFSMQHDATMLSDGNVLVFDNGLFRKHEVANYWSRIIEISPQRDGIIWKYEAGDTNSEKAFLASSIMGGAQRLTNGNTLITSTTQGRFLEVEQEGNIVWDYTNEFRSSDGDPQVVFKANVYDPRGTDWEQFLPMSLSFCLR